MLALIIDDSAAIRTILQGMLGEMGFETATAKDGQQGLDQLKKLGSAEVALVDWNMPIMNGYEFVQEVRKINDFDSTKLMMVTTETEMEQVVKAISAGVNEYVMKPFTKEMIADKLKIMGIPV